jgi:hypothetical protein
VFPVIAVFPEQLRQIWRIREPKPNPQAGIQSIGVALTDSRNQEKQARSPPPTITTYSANPEVLVRANAMNAPPLASMRPNLSLSLHRTARPRNNAAALPRGFVSANDGMPHRRPPQLPNPACRNSASRLITPPAVRSDRRRPDRDRGQVLVLGPSRHHQRPDTVLAHHDSETSYRNRGPSSVTKYQQRHIPRHSTTTTSARADLSPDHESLIPTVNGCASWLHILEPLNPAGASREPGRAVIPVVALTRQPGAMPARPAAVATLRRARDLSEPSRAI